MNDLERQTPWQNINLPSQIAPPVGGAPIREIDEAASLQDYWRVIQKHKWKIVGCVVASLSVAVIYILMATPTYTASATLLIEPKSQRVVKFEEMLSEPTQAGENEYYQSQFEMLKSRSLAADAIKNGRLDKNSVFISAVQERSFAQRLKAAINGWWRAAIGIFVANQGGQAKIDNPYGVAPEYIDRYNLMLNIEPVKRSRLVKIGFSTPDPMLSANLANAHAEAYMRQERMLRSQANQEARQFLESQIADLKNRVESSEAALNRFRKGKGIISLDNKENIVVERLADLNRRLTEAEVERIGLESQARLIKRRDYDSLPAVINNSLIQSLKGQLVNLEGQYANLAAQFKSGYPPVAKLKAQIDDTRHRLKQQVSAVVEGIKSAYMAAATKEKTLSTEMNNQKAMALALKDDAVDYAILKREADTDRKLYDAVLEQVREIRVTAAIPSSNRSILDIAEVPGGPSHPRANRALMLAGLAGLIGGLGLVLVLEYLNNTLTTPEEIERYLGLPNLAVVPDFFCLSKVVAKSYPGNGRGITSRDGELYLPGKKLAPLNLP
ncbi:MAG: GumC family protein, partial [Deltaproteobacteria bacterium]|nr:GumC family protein [Deltaproteobacteria bacterium]